MLTDFAWRGLKLHKKINLKYMKMDNRDIFEQIGNLFYAIAADQNIKTSEVAELKLLISKYWLPRNLEENESLVSDETHFILTTMDALEREKASAKDAFKEFSRFLANHPEVFTKEVKLRIFETAEEITRIFHADNLLKNAHLRSLENILGLSLFSFIYQRIKKDNSTILASD